MLIDNTNMAAKLDFTTFRNVINGKLTSAAVTRHSFNPSTGEPNPQVPISTAEDVDAAVAAAQEAFKLWSKTSHEERAKAVLGLADAIEAHAEQFLDLTIREQGKPVSISLSLANGHYVWQILYIQANHE